MGKLGGPTPNQLLAIGIHPATGRDVAKQSGRRCNNCALAHGEDEQHPKLVVCLLQPHHPLIKTTWPACSAWTPRHDDDRPRELWRYAA